MSLTINQEKQIRAVRGTGGKELIARLELYDILARTVLRHQNCIRHRRSGQHVPPGQIKRLEDLIGDCLEKLGTKP